MIAVDRKNKGVTISNIWYASQTYKKPGIHYYYESLLPLGKDTTSFRTLISDLTLTKEDIVQKYTKTTRYKSRRAGKEGVTVQILFNDEITQDEISQLCSFFKEFWESKGKNNITEETIYKQVKDYIKENRLCISKACYKGKVIVYHTHLLCEDTARLYQSASMFRIDEEINKNFIGMANCYLHQEDMFAFKDKGFLKYDWGGAGLEEEVASITEFKTNFGGDEAYFYNGTEIVGFWPKLATMLLKLLHK